MNGYVAIFKGKQIDIHADSLYLAKLRAMSDCTCGEWDMYGYCIKCGEHYTDKWDKHLATIQQLSQALEKIANQETGEWKEGCPFSYVIAEDALQEQGQ